MTNEPQLDLFTAPAIARPAAKPTGEVLRDRGMQRAADHADAVEPTWSDRALELVRVYARSNEFVVSECVRIAAEKRGFPTPPDKRAWGAVLARARRAGFLEWHSYTRASDPKVHKNPVSKWRSLICGENQ